MMNISYYQNQVSRIEREISDLQKKIFTEGKKEIDKNRQIASVNKSITKSTSPSSLQSKYRQIQGYENDILNCKKKMADYQQKISSKTAELGKKKQDLRKAEESNLKRENQKQLDFQKSLERSINDQKRQLDLLLKQNYTSKETKVLQEEDTEKEYDFFISHASEDKDEIVRELAEALSNCGFEVWYDEFQLKIGDSLRKKIDQGLVNSKYGIVIVSPSFIKKNWTEYEFNGMVAREMNGHKVILPIWHKVTKDEVLKFSPSLADKMALNTSVSSIEEIVKTLKELIE
ncbi:toll/interleukin-1 receptor domain-containing protein [Myroides marinus]|uniref:toll/interleukin-1 receptor domain-containing protein n=1 Tax=Myroides marinus TaxID=703342 RepID=UPI0025771303|nr:toll/interleukin-1 receptor domain-containing protein [Myroides marinus]